MPDDLVAVQRSYRGPHPDDGVSFTLNALADQAARLWRDRVADPLYNFINGHGSAEAARRAVVAEQYRIEAQQLASDDRDPRSWWRDLPQDAQDTFRADQAAGLVPDNHPIAIGRQQDEPETSPEPGDTRIVEASPGRFRIEQYDLEEGSLAWGPVNTAGIESYGLDGDFQSREAAHEALEEYELDQEIAVQHYDREPDERPGVTELEVLNRQALDQEAKLELADDDAEERRRQAEWDGMTDSQRAAIVAEIDDQMAQGEFSGHEFYDQYLDHPGREPDVQDHPFAGPGGSEREQAWEDAQIAAHAEREIEAAWEERDYVTHGEWVRNFKAAEDLDAADLARIDARWAAMSKDAKDAFLEERMDDRVPDDHPFLAAHTRAEEKYAHARRSELAGIGTMAAELGGADRVDPVNDNVFRRNFAIERNAPGWEAAWQALAHEIKAQGLGDGADLVQRSRSGETWQYMQSAIDEASAVSHQFRHRDHPVTNSRVLIEAPQRDARHSFLAQEGEGVER